MAAQNRLEAGIEQKHDPGQTKQRTLVQGENDLVQKRVKRVKEKITGQIPVIRKIAGKEAFDDSFQRYGIIQQKVAGNQDQYGNDPYLRKHEKPFFELK